MSIHNVRNVLCAALLGVTLCLSLGACAGTSAPEQQQPTNTFEGREARDASEMDDFVEKAVTIGTERESKVKDKKTDGNLTKKQQEALVNANALYKEGKFAEAQAAYEEILDAHATNFGANVNLTLAQLQQDKSEDALVQALTCVYLFPNESGPILNAQVAGVAQGFGVQDVNDAVKGIRSDKSTNYDRLMQISPYANELTYNVLWDDIDTKLHEEATSDQKPSQSNYQKLREELADLLNKTPDDPDVLALVEYFEAAGQKIGQPSSGLLEKDDDESSAEEKVKADDKAAEEEAVAKSSKGDTKSSDDKA